MLEGWAKTKPCGSSWALLVVKADLTVFSENRGSPYGEKAPHSHQNITSSDLGQLSLLGTVRV